MSADTPSAIEKRVTLRAPRSRVWRALTDVAEFCRWFGVDTGDGELLPGARLHMRSRRGNACEDFYMFVEQVQPESLFSWRWHPGAREAIDYSAEPTTLVVFTLRDAAGGGTELIVTESGFNQISLARRAKVYRDNDAGWADQLQALMRYVM